MSAAVPLPLCPGRTCRRGRMRLRHERAGGRWRRVLGPPIGPRRCAAPHRRAATSRSWATAAPWQQDFATPTPGVGRDAGLQMARQHRLAGAAMTDPRYAEQVDGAEVSYVSDYFS